MNHLDPKAKAIQETIAQIAWNVTNRALGKYDEQLTGVQMMEIMNGIKQAMLEHPDIHELLIQTLEHNSLLDRRGRLNGGAIIEHLEAEIKQPHLPGHAAMLGKLLQNARVVFEETKLLKGANHGT